MEPKYIVAIAALSVFCVLFIIFFVLLARRRRLEAKLQIWLHEVYADKNLVKMDYDTASVDEEVSRLAEKRTDSQGEEQLTAEQEPKEEQLKIEEAFGKIEIEGIEEITGNYKPE